MNYLSKSHDFFTPNPLKKTLLTPLLNADSSGVHVPPNYILDNMQSKKSQASAQ